MADIFNLIDDAQHQLGLQCDVVLQSQVHAHTNRLGPGQGNNKTNFASDSLIPEARVSIIAKSTQHC
eukprot:9407310-Prorocentrum_lima.AAC.1